MFAPVTVVAGYEPCSGIFKATKDVSCGKKVYANDSGAILRYETEGGNWGAGWIRGAGWFIRHGGHHMYGVKSESPTPPFGPQPWQVRVRGKLPCKISSAVQHAVAGSEVVVETPHVRWTNGPYRAVGEHNDHPVFENANGARMRFESLDNPSDWAANKWLQHDCWVIRHDEHDLFSTYHDGTSLPIGTDSRGKPLQWKTRRGSKLPVRVSKRGSGGPSSDSNTLPKKSKLKPQDQPKPAPAVTRKDLSDMRSPDGALESGTPNAQRMPLGAKGKVPVQMPAPSRIDDLPADLEEDVKKVQDSFKSDGNDAFFMNPILPHKVPSQCSRNQGTPYSHQTHDPPRLCQIDVVSPAKDIGFLQQRLGFLLELSDREILRRIPVQVPMIH